MPNLLRRLATSGRIFDKLPRRKSENHELSDYKENPAASQEALISQLYTLIGESQQHRKTEESDEDVKQKIMKDIKDTAMKLEAEDNVCREGILALKVSHFESICNLNHEWFRSKEKYGSLYLIIRAG